MLDDLLIFWHVVDSGSYTAAAKRLAVSKSAVSKSVVRLEDRLKTRLLTRNTRQVRPTELGREVYHRASSIHAEYRDVVDWVHAQRNEVEGVLRVTATAGFGMTYVQPVLAGMIRDFPGLKVELLLSAQFVDLVGDGIDVAIRIAHLTDSNLIASPLAKNRPMLVASPDFIACHGEPHHPKDLEQHRCILYTDDKNSQNRWMYEHEGQFKLLHLTGVYRVNDGRAMVNAACDGMGIALSASFLAQPEVASGRLIELLPHVDWKPFPDIQFVYPARNYLPPRVSVFMQRMREHLAGKSL